MAKRKKGNPKNKHSNTFNQRLIKVNKNTQIKIGIGLILLSGVSFAVMLIIPMLDIESKNKVIGSSAAFITMEVLFYAGGFLVGKELFKKYKAYLNPKNWFKPRNQNNDHE